MFKITFQIDSDGQKVCLCSKYNLKELELILEFSTDVFHLYSISNNKLESLYLFSVKILQSFNSLKHLYHIKTIHYKS